MGEIKNLSREKAIEKMRKIVDNNHTALLMTDLKKQPISTRPMYTQEVDKNGNFWFLSDNSGEHNTHIERDKQVQLSYANEGKTEYLSVYGKATIVKDRERIEKYWSSMAKAWFDGIDDPRITILKITPDQSFYWDTKNNRLVSLLKIAASAVSDKKMDDGVSGKLKTKL